VTTEEVKEQITEMVNEREQTKRLYIDIAKLSEEIASNFTVPWRGVVRREMLAHFLKCERVRIGLQLQSEAMAAMQRPSVIAAAGSLPKAN